MGKIRSTIDSIKKVGADEELETQDVVKTKEAERIGATEDELVGTNVIKGATVVLPTEELGVTEEVEQQSDEEGLGTSGREALIQRAKDLPKGEGTAKLAMPGPFLQSPGDIEPVDNLKARVQKVEEERVSQEERTPAQYLQDDFYNFKDAKTLKDRFKNEREVPKQTINAVLSTSLDIERLLPNLEKQLATDNTPDTMKLKAYLTNKGMLNQGNTETGVGLKFNKRLVNGIAMEALGLIQDHVNRKQVSYKKRESGINEQDMSDFFGGTAFDAPELGVVQGERLDPTYIRGRVGVNLLNALVDNPNKTGIYYSEYGGEGDSLLKSDPKVAAMFDGMIMGIFNDMGFFEEIYDEDSGQSYYAISIDGLRYFDNARDILWATGMRQKEDVSLIPTGITEGEKVPFTPTPKDKGPVTVKSKMAKTQRIQRKTKAHLGRVEYAISEDAVKFIKSVAEYIITEPELKNERPIIKSLNHPPERVFKPGEKEEIRARLTQEATNNAANNVALRNKSQAEIDSHIATDVGRVMNTIDQDRSKFYSNDPLAEVLGLHEGKWLEHWNFADKNPGSTPESNTEHANTQMKLKAREIYETLMDSDRLKNKVFYMKLFNALANNRIMYRNIVMNPQNDKIARNILTNARRVVIDLRKPLSAKHKRIMQSWKAIIGKNLLPAEMIGGLKTENLTIDSLIDGTNRVINRKSPEAIATYDNWLKIGRELRSLSSSKHKRINIVAIKALMEKTNILGYKALDNLKSREDWNYVFQSYIDFANWHDASNVDRNPSLITVGKELSMEEEGQLATLQNQHKEAKAAGDEATAADLETQMMDIANNVVWSDTVPRETTFSPKAQAQFDGKQNGIAIQAIQNGDIDLMKQTGLIFSSDDNIIPQGDIRKAFADHTQDAIKGIVFKGGSERINNKKAFWLDVFDNFKGKEDPTKIFKELSKQPLMETSYGKYAFFHRETAEDFYNGIGQKDIQDARNRYANMLPDYDADEIIDDLNEIIGSTLTLTLDLKHQKVLKDVGKLYSMLGVTPNFRGPLGETIFLGSKEYKESNETIGIPTSRGVVRRNIGQMKASGSNRSKRQRVYDDQTREWRTSDPTPFGQEVANQIVVLLIQHIDAGIMYTAINRVNDKRRPKEGAAYVIPIHDAIVVDSTSLMDYRPAINNSFTDINMTYSIPEVIDESINEALVNFERRIKGDELYELSLDSEFRTMQNYLDDIFKRAEERKELAQNTSDRDVMLMNRAVENGYKPEGSKIKGAQLKKILFSINQHMNITPMFSEWRKNSKKFRQKSFNEMLRKPMINADGERVLRFITENYS